MATEKETEPKGESRLCKSFFKSWDDSVIKQIYSEKWTEIINNAEKAKANK